MTRGQRRKLHLSKLYSFSCIRLHGDDKHAQIGERGYSRIVYCNDPNNPAAVWLNYKGNYVSTTKYTAANFVPKSLFEQFRRVANIYFLVVACLSFSPLAPFTALSFVGPLVLVIGGTMAKEALEDWRRSKQDVEANNRKVSAYSGNGTFHRNKWKNLRVGSVVKVYKDEYFPADLLLLSSSYEDGICYVDTMNLDGETNLKLKQSLDVTSSLRDDRCFQIFTAVIKCEDPNDNLYSFVGNLHYNGKEYPLYPQQILLRDSKLKNTDYVYGVVIFTGHDAKVMQNATHPRSKRSKIEKRMDKIIYILFSTLILISIVGSFFFGIETRRDLVDQKYRRWYLRPDDTTVFYDATRASLSAFFHFLTGLMLYGYLIPISLYVSIEIVKVLQSVFINQDLNMYYEAADKPARARTSNLNEELGQVHIIFSDKTGTLTCNSMEFVKCSIAGISYGQGETEVERALARRDRPFEANEISIERIDSHGDAVHSGMHKGHSVKGFNFRDERIMNGRWVDKPYPDLIRKFFEVLAICHTVIPDVNRGTEDIYYEAESRDEAAFVIAARELGFEFFKRKETSISLRELDYERGEKIVRNYDLLHVLEFSSSRKRMSVIVRSEGNLLLLCKGADSVMFERLSKDGRLFESETRDHIDKYSRVGLRIMVIAYRELGEEEYKIWEEEFLKAKASVSADRDALLDTAADKIERELILLGATAVEDKLQEGVPKCIKKLAQAQIRVWVLTGDKLETAVNIGYACGLLRQGMKEIVITLDSHDIKVLEKQGDREALAKASLESITKQIRKGKSQLSSAREDAMEFGLIIDGKSLNFALTKNLEDSFLDLAINCASVICCQSSPKQKALVTRLVKVKLGKTTLSVGDGANDVSMLQEADIGVGISGVEGMQAVMASDFAIAQFRFLERLLLVHGHWCYRRIAMMICYFFYKNIAFGFTLFWFEAYASFSGQPAYNDWDMSFYNVFFTSLPVIALGVFDQDVSACLCLEYPPLYQEGTQNILFSWSRILGWMANGVGSSIIIFFCTTNVMVEQAFRRDGRVSDFEVLGVTMYTCVVWAVNCQMAISINYFTWIQHFFIWGSIAFWYIFMLIYGYLSPTISTTAYMVFLEATTPSLLYWLSTLLVVVSTLLPYFSYRAFQTRLQPMPHDLIQRTRRECSEIKTSGELSNPDQGRTEASKGTHEA
ncbi:probable phospholipid-transporting ATPase 8 isoform X1 [Syzygium oleosum]|uniref:probable phospholipid-transporting ATPase 8 isoform X1 n=1 Tax=Syzygium oleosum TaxID=219896 RepID=UPI0024B9B243|nr:probable phospholipid-transporting ATPase 8 isoform X1 [Syzygium oleosum]XP_056169794.1 probable phospholipid-transporting ATPase 8 isoform X1 [Syzygium oleosum]